MTGLNAIITLLGKQSISHFNPSEVIEALTLDVQLCIDMYEIADIKSGVQLASEIRGLTETQISPKTLALHYDLYGVPCLCCLKCEFPEAVQRKIPHEMLLMIIQDSDKLPDDPNSIEILPVCSCSDSCHEEDEACIHEYAALRYFQNMLTRFQSEAPDLQMLRAEAVFQQLEASIQRVLQMDRLIAPVSSEATGSDDTRVVFRLKPHRYRPVLILEPCLQQRTKKSWTGGRKIPWSDYLQRPANHQTPLQQRLAQFINDLAYQQDGYYSSIPPELIMTEGLLRELVGSNEIYWTGNKLLSIRTGQLTLDLTPDPRGGDRVSLRVCIGGHPAGDIAHLLELKHSIVAIYEDEPELVIAECPSHLRNLLKWISSNRPKFPQAFAPRLIEQLRKVETRVPMAVSEKLVARSRPAELVWLLQVGPGTNVRLRVQVVGSEHHYHPGTTPDSVLLIEKGEHVRVERSLPEERTKGRQLAETLLLDRLSPVGEWDWKTSTTDDLLELVDRVRQLDDAGLKLVWVDQAPMEILGEITPETLKLEIKGNRDWFGLKGTIELAGQQFPFLEILTAIRTGQKYLQLANGKWASISELFRNRLQAVDDVLHQTRGKLEFGMPGVPMVADLVSNDVSLKAVRKWKEMLNRLEDAERLDPQLSNSFTAELRDYQLDGFRWLSRLAAWGVGGILADDMGLGKTIQALAVLVDRQEIGPALVIAPASVGFNWLRETERFAPTLRPILYRDSGRSEMLPQLESGDLVVTTYQLAQRDYEDLSQVRWGTLILDEAQFIKNSQTKTSQAIRELEADWKLALTGTPMENHLGELWSIFRAISPGVFGSQERFRERYSNPIEKEKDHSRRQALARTVRPFVLRRTKSEVLSELPQRTEIQLTAELSADERKRYDDARLWAISNLTDLTTSAPQTDHRFQVLAALTKLRQLACHPGLIDENWTGTSAKLDLFLETVEELREGRHRALVFSQFTQHLGLMRAALDDRGITYKYLDGSTPVAQRQELVDAFQRGEGDLFLISLKAGGTGLNLTAADYVIHMDPWWNPAVEDQATDRAHRIGQSRPVTVYRLVTKDTIEEQILAMHSEKRDLVSGVLDGSDKAGKMTTAELIRLIREG